MKFKPALSLRQIAVLRFLWSIDSSERNLLDECFLLQAEAYELLEGSHIYFHGINHLVLWTEKTPINLRHPVLLSIRRNRASSFAVALVRVRDRLPEGLQHLLSLRSDRSTVNGWYY